MFHWFEQRGGRGLLPRSPKVSCLDPYRTFQIANAYLQAATSYGFGALPGQLGNTVNRQARATQSVPQDFPPLAHADRMRLQHPAHHDLVGRGG
jgi:hypothetical protein